MKKVCELGRSMVEMLGVLAIIGVLSVGGIAGYSKAMFKYKANQMLDTLSRVIARIVEIDGQGINGNLLRGDDMKDTAALGIDCECNDDGCTRCLLPLNGTYNFSFNSSAGHFMVQFDGDTAQDACVVYLGFGIYKNVPEEWWYPKGHIYVYNGTDTEYFYGKSENAMALGAKSDVTTSDISRVCAVCGDQNDGYEPSCRIVWNIKEGF